LSLIKLKTRALLASTLAVTFLSSPLSCLALERQYSSTFDGHEHDSAYYPKKVTGEKREDGGLTLKGEVEFCVPKGTPIKMKLASVPTSGLRLMDRDLDGNLRPAKLGQELTSKTTEDIFVDTNRVIPAGTTFYGYVSKILPPRSFNRPGHVEIKFDKLKLPDGREFAFGVQADNFKKSTAKSKLKGAGRIAAYAGGGAAMGAIVAYSISGLQTTISCHGYNIAAGAAVGAIAATTYAMMKKGRAAVLEPGDDLNMNIDCDLLMPVAQKPTPKKPLKHVEGLEIAILKTRKKADRIGGQVMQVDMQIENNTRRTIRSIDMYLEDSEGNREPISVSTGDEESQMWFDIPPYSLEKIRVHFGMEYPKLKHRIVLLDHSSRRPIHFVEL